jgi:lipoprotein-anchoring transpeptidase ErfK/SrfK
MRFAALATAAAALLAGCALDDGDDPETGDYEGVAYDEENPNGVMDDGKSDAPRYPIPTDLPVLVAPEIIVSLAGLTAHLFDRETGFSAVYPVGVGVIRSRGVSITPTGHFKTGADIGDGWWYVPRRTVPEYFAGLPFLRLTARNSNGANTYALHGPITDELIRGYVSHGCVRMARQNIIDLFWMVNRRASTPVTIQQEVEIDAAGMPVDVGRTAAVWPVGAPIAYGASVGPRPF